MIGESPRRSDSSHTPNVPTNCSTVLLAGSRTIMGHTLFLTGEFVEAKAHFDKGSRFTMLSNTVHWRRAFG
jgi:hypothetical protein